MDPYVEISGMRGRAVPYIILALRLGVRLRRIPFEAQIKPGTYYTFARKIGRRLGDYYAWRTARLLDRKVAKGFSGLARVYTDVADASLRRSGETKHRLLKIIISVLALDDTYFILAACAKKELTEKRMGRIIGFQRGQKPVGNNP